MNEGIRARVTFVLGEVEAHAAAHDGDEPRKAGLELMVPLLLESEAPVPGNSSSCVLDLENRYYLFVHATEVTQESKRGHLACASVRECTVT